MLVKAHITANWNGRGYTPLETLNAQAYSIDTALDTDTDSWNLQFGDLDGRFIDMLDRSSEVRLDIFGITAAHTMSLNKGFADQVILRENGIFQVSGRDFTSVAVDSQHPPQIWKQIRPHSLVATEARTLKIGSSLELDKVPGFKSYSTDGSESWWQVWYRFYRKRRRWLYATPNGKLIASTLNYNEEASYYFGEPTGTNWTRTGQSWIPVEAAEWRADKTQRVGEVFIFGHNHHGKVGFVAHEKDDTIRRWVKRPTRIVSSSDVHNAAEARAEALEEIFESKVGAVEIKLTVAGDYMIEQNKMAFVNLPQMGLRNKYFVVGVETAGSMEEGTYQTVRLRERFFAITRRVPVGPKLQPGPDGTSERSDIAEGLQIGLGEESWKQYFIDAAIKYHSVWPFQLFLGVLLAICDQESSFQNEREGGSIIYPGSYPSVPAGQIPRAPIPSPRAGSQSYEDFVAHFSNSVGSPAAPFYGSRETGVGPMQLTTLGYKLLADRLAAASQPSGPSPVGDDLLGGRWLPQWNIMAAAAALNSKLGAGVSISPEGQIRTVPVSGLSLNPTEENIWEGVAAYNGSSTADKYAQSVRSKYDVTYKTDVEQAVKAGSQTSRKNDVIMSSKAGRGLQNDVLNNSAISFNPGSAETEKNDIKTGQIDPRVLKFLLAITEAGFPVIVWALKNDHTHLGKASAHAWGLAVDLGNYGKDNPETPAAAKWIRDHQDVLGYSQMIYFNWSDTVPPMYYDSGTMADHQDHIHVGWPCPECPKYRRS